MSERSYKTMTAGKAGRHSRKLARRRTRQLEIRKYNDSQDTRNNKNDYKRKRKEMHDE